MNKLKGEKYKLLWKESPDFVRLASKLDCTIVPFAAVGGKQLCFRLILSFLTTRAWPVLVCPDHSPCCCV